MRTERIAQLRSPGSGSALRLADAVRAGDDVQSGTLLADDGATFRIEDGVPNFVDPARLSTVEAETRAEYERVAAGVYDAAVDWQFAALREDENAVREGTIDMLHLAPGQSVLEIGCGTGRDSARLARRIPGGLLHMQDLSPAMVHRCAGRMSTLAAPCTLEYTVSSVLALPFADGAFDAVFHFGGFNQFGDLRRGAAEMTRVTKPGGRIVIGDEAVAPWLKGTEFEAIVTTNNPLFRADAPLDALPEGARDVTVRWIMANCFYVIGFTRGDGPPPLDLDLPHQGWRGGTMRSRYFGRLEGVTVEAKALAAEAARAAGVSVHEWLDRVVKDAARKQ
jgi:ubiquinone/menaquinone biosynthesis C-methylase UbiE